MKKLLISASFLFLLTYLFLAPVRQAVAEAPVKLMEIVNWPELLNVNVVNEEPIEVTMDGESALEPQLIQVYDNRPLSYYETLKSDNIDVRGYSKVAIYATRTNTESFRTINLQGRFTIDDTTIFGSDNENAQANPTYDYPAIYDMVDVAGPNFYVYIRNSGVPDISVWVYLIP